MLKINILSTFNIQNLHKLAILAPLESQKVPMHVNVSLLVLYYIILGKNKRLKIISVENTAKGSNNLKRHLQWVTTEQLHYHTMPAVVYRFGYRKLPFIQCLKGKSNEKCIYLE